MGYPVILTPQSQDDLKSIVKFIRRDSPQRARAFGNALIDEALSIGPFPEIGRIVPELDDCQVREIIHGSYRIIYEIVSDPTAIYILRFWHAARGTPEVT
jgi:plasmid stabilization system protein ParE